MKNFRYLDDLIHSTETEIVLDSDIVLDDVEESEYLEGILLDVSGLTIDGNGHTIDAKGLTRVFKVSEMGISLKNICFKNGFSQKYGGAVYNRGFGLKIFDCIFENNASEGEGGAVFNVCRLIMRDCKFTNNASKRNGGAVCIYHSRGKIYTCTFTGNSSDSDGGAIDNSGLLETDECIFKSNSTKGKGGAIHSAKFESKIIPNTRCAKIICCFEDHYSEFEDNAPDDIYEEKRDRS